MPDRSNGARSGHPTAPGDTGIDDLERLWDASDDDLPFHRLRRDDLSRGLCGLPRTRTFTIPLREVPKDRRCPECETIHRRFR